MQRMTKRLLLPALILFIFSGCEKKNTPNEFPDMPIRFTSGGEMNLKEIDANAVLVLYQPDCDHCQREAREIKSHMDSFRQYGVFFITNYQFNQINAFARIQQLDQESNVFFAQTDVNHILDHFGPIETPSVFIYREGKKVAQFIGETPIDQIIEAL